MHPSAVAAMAGCIQTYMERGRHYDVVDFGSRISDGQRSTHRVLLEGYDCRYTGVDIEAGPNVDAVMSKPYRVPLRTGSVDIVLTGQVFEHIPFFWASFLELARIVRPGGYIFLTVPSRGHAHDVYDCWRYYPDSMRALAAISRLDLQVGSTDFPPTQPGGGRFDYDRLDVAGHYWGDTTGVFRKPLGYRDLEVLPFREIAVWWANRVGDLSHVPGTDDHAPGRRRELPSPVRRQPLPLRKLVRREASRRLPAPMREVYRAWRARSTPPVRR